MNSLYVSRKPSYPPWKFEAGSGYLSWTGRGRGSLDGPRDHYILIIEHPVRDVPTELPSATSEIRLVLNVDGKVLENYRGVFDLTLPERSLYSTHLAIAEEMITYIQSFVPTRLMVPSMNRADTEALWFNFIQLVCADLVTPFLRRNNITEFTYRHKRAEIIRKANPPALGYFASPSF
jgi:hypothetical protein